MGKYLVTIEGTNVYLKNEGSGIVNRYGFFCSRILKASDEPNAIKEAISLVNKELENQGIVNDADSKPYLKVDGIRKIGFMESLSVSNKGFTFYCDNDLN